MWKQPVLEAWIMVPLKNCIVILRCNEKDSGYISEMLIIFCVLIWVLITRMCLVSENLSSPIRIYACFYMDIIFQKNLILINIEHLKVIFKWNIFIDLFWLPVPKLYGTLILLLYFLGASQILYLLSVSYH